MAHIPWLWDALCAQPHSQYAPCSQDARSAFTLQAGKDGDGVPRDPLPMYPGIAAGTYPTLPLSPCHRLPQP